MSEINIESVKSYLLSLQDKICQQLEDEEPIAKFLEESWTRPQGGGGKTKVLENGSIIEKAGVNFSHILGEGLPPSATLQRPELTGCKFQAIGISVIVHPKNPYVPTTHANLRLFFAEDNQGKAIWWFGGGFDLTPYYGFEEDCVHWHQMAKNACLPFGEKVYPRFKKWCDEYFYLKHRQEPRGIGGLFFDDLNQWGFDHCFSFLQSVGDHFLLAYLPILQKRKDISYGEHEREFQLYRRGRYVEFNLIHDRGTLFGLQSGGRTESILVSLPSPVVWRYNWQPEKNSPEEKLYKEFLVIKEWI